MSASINKVRMIPRLFTPSKIPQTRDLCQRHGEVRHESDGHPYDIMADMKSYDGENVDITNDIIACAIEVHKTLGGPGILEKVYQHALAYELQAHGHRAQLEAPCPIVYKGRDLSDPEHPLRIDILVDDTVVVECKAGAYNPVYAAQCLTYLRLKKLKTGLVINFGLPKLVDGVERVSN